MTNNLKNSINNLIKNNIIICGKMTKENGVIKFKRINYNDIDNLKDDEEVAYATSSMGRAIFTIDENGKTHNYKGVDSQLKSSEIGTKSLVDAKNIDFKPNIKDEDSKNLDTYTISAILYKDNRPDIRIKGLAPLEDLEIEGLINKEMSSFGIKVPEIKYIKEFPQEFNKKHGLPIQVPGSLNDFKSDYAIEDDKRKLSLNEFYKENYMQELKDNFRPETMKEYLERIGFLNSKDFNASISAFGYNSSKFVKAVDSSYSRGQRYGQAERIMDNPFRISDLETCLKSNNINHIKAILNFTKECCELNNINFQDQLSSTFGKNAALLINNGWECESLMHRQDFSLTGEFCDDSYFNIFKPDILEKINSQNTSKQNNPVELYKAQSTFEKYKRRYTGQIMHYASCIKVVQDSINLVQNPNKENIDNTLLDKFIESFTSNLDFEKIGNLAGITKEDAQQAFLSDFSKPKKWSEQLAEIEPNSPNQKSKNLNAEILNAHIENESFYNETSIKIAESISKSIKKEKENTNTISFQDIGKSTISTYINNPEKIDRTFQNFERNVFNHEYENSNDEQGDRYDRC